MSTPTSEGLPRTEAGRSFLDDFLGVMGDPHMAAQLRDRILAIEAEAAAISEIPTAPECICGLDVCPKHDGVFVVPTEKPA